MNSVLRPTGSCVRSICVRRNMHVKSVPYDKYSYFVTPHLHDENDYILENLDEDHYTKMIKFPLSRHTSVFMMTDQKNSNSLYLWY